MTESRKAVFLSYAWEDAEAAARICTSLRTAGIEVWFDQSALRGGDAWDQQIRKHIKACALFIPVISANAHGRIESYFRLEWKLAVDRSHLIAPDQAFLLPVAIDDTPQTDERIPDRFREMHWSRLPGGDTPPAFVERVSRLLSPEPAHGPAQVRSPAAGAPHSATAPRQPAASPAASRQTQRVPLVIAAVVVIGFGYLAVDKFILSKRPAPSTASAPAPAVQSVAPAPIANQTRPTKRRTTFRSRK